MNHKSFVQGRQESLTCKSEKQHGGTKQRRAQQRYFAGSQRGKFLFQKTNRKLTSFLLNCFS
jgi:hypothetical protein